MTQYPGQDPDDPFAKPPNESGTPRTSGSGSGVGDETAPISGQTPPPAPPPEQPGYWEQQAAQQAGQQPQGSNPGAGYGEPSSGAVPPPPPPAQGYGQPYDQPAYGQQPYAQPAYGAPGYGVVPPPNHPNSTTALVLGIISIACCGIAGPFAWWIGGKARREIRESNGQLGGDGAATAGWIMGIIATVLLVLGVLAVVVLVVVGLATSGSSGSSTNF